MIANALRYIGSRGVWDFEISLNFRQWMIGFNVEKVPFRMWNVFVGPLRIGGYVARQK